MYFGNKSKEFVTCMFSYQKKKKFVILWFLNFYTSRKYRFDMFPFPFQWFFKHNLRKMYTAL